MDSSHRTEKPWKETPLGEVLTRSNEIADIVSSETYREVTIRLWGKGVILRHVIEGQQIIATRRFLVRQDQFILSRIDARNGAFGLVSPELDGAVVSNDFPSYKIAHDRLLPSFLGWMCRTRNFVSLCQKASEGTTNRVRLQEDRFLSMSIPLPPLSEQRRIVAKIDQLAGRIEEARGLRKMSQLDLDILPGRVTSGVFTGGWECKPLGSLLREKSRNGLSSRPSDSPPGVPILRISAGTSRSDGYVDETDYKYLVVTEKELGMYTLKPDDLLACRFNGNLHYVGRFSLFTGESSEPRLYPDKLIRFRVDKASVLPKYFLCVMNSPFGRKKIEAFCNTTAGNIGISAKNLNTIEIPVPPLSEQCRIVEHLDNIRAKVESLKELQAKTSAELDALLPSILDRAFKGEL